MRIERIRVANLKESGNIDWTLPPGPTCYFSEKKSSQRVLNFLLRVFYNYETPSTPADLNSQGSIEVWVSRDHSRYHINQSIIQMGDDSLEGSPTLVIEDENRISVSLPNSTTLGEFLFRVKSSAFLQGGVIEWPLQSDGDDLLGLVRNLRNGGDEKFSLAKVRDSISGALKKVNNQMGNMVFVKAEYDTLRRDWEIAHRQREEQQLLLIELKNLQERERILDERLIAAAKLEERIDVLTQNPDYRELRQLQVEVTRLKDLCRDSEVDLLDLTHNYLVDRTMVERLREECIEWANYEKQVEHITAKVKKREEYINELGSFLKSSGYRDLDEDAVEHLRQAEEDRTSTQEELDKLIILKQEIEKIQDEESEERTRLQEFDIMTSVTKTDEVKFAEREKHLKQWQNSKFANLLDLVWRELLGVTSIGERLLSGLARDYQSYHVSSYEEFTNQLKKYREQQRRVEELQIELARLQEKVDLEEKLYRILNSRTETLKRAFSVVNVMNFQEWQNGWKAFQQKKLQLDIELEALQLELGRQKTQVNKMAACAEQLRDKIGSWGTLATNREQVLAEVLKVARQLRIQEDAEREAAVFTKRLIDALGDRNIDHLRIILEPLAELEREINVSNEERQTKLSNINTERLEIHERLKLVEQRLRGGLNLTSLSVLENKIEKTKHQLTDFENLNNALQDVLNLFEVSWHDWQTKYGKELDLEAERIANKISSSSTQGMYFAYRMAVAQLALGNTSEVPLFFIVEETKNEQDLWEDILRHLHKLSGFRQVVLATSDEKLWRRVQAAGWQTLA